MEQIKKAINSLFKASISKRLYLIDNSPNNKLKVLKKIDERIEYIWNGENIGYGKAHNIAIRKSIINDTKYHVVLNPDIYFGHQVTETLYYYMEKHKDVGNIMPQILYENEDIQYLAKLLPSPFDLIFRRFLPFKSLAKKRMERYELRFTEYKDIMNVPYLSGCFMFLRIESLKKVGLFDENIFMYLEDTDLNRRIHKEYQTIFYPEVSVYHGYAKESYKSIKLLKCHIESALYYFNKWGWLFDQERRKINNSFMNKYNE